jgi:hypothetical protein
MCEKDDDDDTDAQHVGSIVDPDPEPDKDEEVLLESLLGAFDALADDVGFA